MLRFRDDVALPPARPRRRDEGASPWTVLFVDDEPLVQAMARRWLEGANIRVVSALSGLDALAALEQSTFDLLIVDLMMPGMCGDELVVRVRERYPALPALATSGLNPDMAAERFAAVRIDAFVPKPFRGPMLLDAVTSILRTTRPLAQHAVSVG